MELNNLQLSFANFQRLIMSDKGRKGLRRSLPSTCVYNNLDKTLSGKYKFYQSVMGWYPCHGYQKLAKFRYLWRNGFLDGPKHLNKISIRNLMFRNSARSRPFIPKQFWKKFQPQPTLCSFDQRKHGCKLNSLLSISLTSNILNLTKPEEMKPKANLIMLPQNGVKSEEKSIES